MFVANSSIKASRDEYNVRGKVPEVRIMVRITREIVMRNVTRIVVRIVMRIVMRIVVRITRITIPNARISVREAMDDKGNNTDGTN